MLVGTEPETTQDLHTQPRGGIGKATPREKPTKEFHHPGNRSPPFDRRAHTELTSQPEKKPVSDPLTQKCS